jgi:hypothetical protein
MAAYTITVENRKMGPIQCRDRPRSSAQSMARKPSTST